MAKKKKQTRKKKVEEPVYHERSPFLAYSGAILLILLGVFALLGGFGTGGTLPKGLFRAAYWLFGYMGYLVPLAFVYWGVTKFASEEKKLPISKLMSLLGVLIFSASWAHVAFGHGGSVGRVLGNLVLDALDKFPAGLLFTVLTVICVFFCFNISLHILAGILNIFKRREREAQEEDGLLALKPKAEQNAFNSTKACQYYTTTPATISRTR